MNYFVLYRHPRWNPGSVSSTGRLYHTVEAAELAAKEVKAENPTCVVWVAETVSVVEPKTTVVEYVCLPVS